MLELIYQLFAAAIILLCILHATFTEDPTGKTHSLLWAILLVLLNREVFYP